LKTEFKLTLFNADQRKGDVFKKHLKK